MTKDPRGTGRTTRALAALSDGGVYVVASVGIAAYCKRLLVGGGRRSDAVKFVTLEGVLNGALRGLPRGTPLAIDHYVWDVASDRHRDKLRSVLDCRLVEVQQ